MQLPELPFTKHTLDNGLEVILRRQANLPVVAANLWYHVGSKNEERNQRGFAHLFEHLMFEGSEHYPGDFFKHLQRFGANINGSTSSDRTNYFVDIPTAYLEIVLAMESDRMANLLPAIDDSKLRIQKGVVKNEYRQSYANRPYGMVWPLLAEALYPPSHPYNWLTIGVMEDLESASLEDVSAFFHRYYVPSNTSLAVVGDLDVDETLAMVDRYFGGIAGGTRALRPWTPEVAPLATRELVLQDRVELERLYMVWHTVPQFEEADAPLGLLADVLARGKASRLHQKLVIDRQIAQDVTVYQAGRELAGSFGVTVTLRPDRAISEARDLVDAELEAIARSAVTAEELERVVTMKTASFLFALEHIGGFGGIADRLNAYNIFRGDPGLITADLKRYREVSADAIREAASRYLAGRPRVSLSVRGRKKATAAPLDRKVAPAAQAPAAYRTPLPKVLRLSNGIPLWVLPQHELPTITLGIAIGGGASLQPPSRPGLAQLTLSMLDEGTRSRSATQIALAAEAMGTSLSASCGWDGAFVSFRCLTPHLEPSLDLALDILREPTFPETEWQRVHGQTLAALRSERDSAEARAYRGLLRAIYGPSHPYRQPLDGHEEAVASLEREEAIEFHRRFLGPGRAGVVVAGAVDPERMARLLEDRLADWAGPEPELPGIPAAPRGQHPRILLLDRPGAPQAVVRVGHVGIARRDPDYDHAMLVNQVLGGQFTSRLNEKLREERGFTYGVRSQFDCRRGAGPFSIAASLQSDRLAEAMDDLYRELLAMVGGRPARQSELDDSRRALIESQARQFETPASLVNRYIHLMVHGLPVDHLATFPERISAIGLDAVNSAAHRQIHPGALVAVIVADASEVSEPLRRLDWAEFERIAD
ncbi:MAG: pitrilysin family protein [Isosphaeraceae bacterium]